MESTRNLGNTLRTELFEKLGKIEEVDTDNCTDGAHFVSFRISRATSLEFVAEIIKEVILVIHAYTEGSLVDKLCIVTPVSEHNPAYDVAAQVCYGVADCLNPEGPENPNNPRIEKVIDRV